MRNTNRIQGPSSFAWALALVGVWTGCAPSGGTLLDLKGADAKERLPAEIASLLGGDVVLCLDEQKADGAYHLWLLRRPGGEWLDYKGLKPRPERHEMPAPAVESLFASRLPALPRGKADPARCRHAHWRGRDGADLHVKEIVTDLGWFASVERLAP